MSIIEDIPEELRSADKLEDFLSWLRILPASLYTKKYMLLDWCEYVGIPMRREYAEAVGLPVQI